MNIKSLSILAAFLISITAVSAASTPSAPCENRADNFITTDGCSPDYIDSDLSGVSDLQSYAFNNIQPRFKELRTIRNNYYSDSRSKRQGMLNAYRKIVGIESVNQNLGKTAAKNDFKDKFDEVMTKNLRHQYEWHNAKVEAVYDLYQEATTRSNTSPSEVFSYNFTGNESADNVDWEVKTLEKEVTRLDSSPTVEIKAIWKQDVDETSGTNTMTFPSNRSGWHTPTFESNNIGANENAHVSVTNSSGDSKPLLKTSYDYGIQDTHNANTDPINDIYDIYSSGEIDPSRLTDPIKAVQQVSEENVDNPFYELKAYEALLKKPSLYTSLGHSFKVSNNGTTAQGQLLVSSEKNISAGTNYSVSCDYYCSPPLLVADNPSDSDTSPEVMELNNNYTVEKIFDKETGQEVNSTVLNESLRIYRTEVGQLDSQIDEHQGFYNQITSGTVGGIGGGSGAITDIVSGVLSPITNAVNHLISLFTGWMP